MDFGLKELDQYGQIALIILVVGGIDWLLVGLIQLELFSSIFGFSIARIFYIIIGAAAIYICYLIYLAKSKKTLPPA